MVDGLLPVGEVLLDIFTYADLSETRNLKFARKPRIYILDILASLYRFRKLQSYSGMVRSACYHRNADGL